MKVMASFFIYDIVIVMVTKILFVDMVRWM